MANPSSIDKDLICITCPMGCALHATLQNGELRHVSGQACKKGAAFAQEELLAPRRVLTTTVRVQNGILPVVPVRSRTPLPKGLLFEVVAILRRMELQAPVDEHQVVLANVLDSGVDIIASRALARYSASEM